MDETGTLEENWVELMIRQGARCRNCDKKATLYFIKFDADTGEKILSKPRIDQHVKLYKLCKQCAIDLDFANDIKTYGFTYNQLRARDDKLDNCWHSKVYGGG